MEIIQIVGLGLSATIFILLVRERAPSFAFLLGLVVCILMFLFVLQKVGTVIGFIENLANQANIGSIYVQTIFKIIGIAYIAEFGAQIARDAGQGAIAQKIELVGKILILVFAIPILQVIVDTILHLLPQ
ncbi:stage III sporulation protein AD [Fodinisporobacter ferrooxydans]|uniref:Stage III sporulation protein AD n=1 Tax=Fodinisporobacter ferrooxydans TaxID=2901836 RepID=A0ABY4CHX2_9BACL|nr:stage III sporulation protein AD [Alicyclobacillaceae bacterium MYW30-H2]